LRGLLKKKKNAEVPTVIVQPLMTEGKVVSFLQQQQRLHPLPAPAKINSSPGSVANVSSTLFL
jgi:hypothetical protein